MIGIYIFMLVLGALPLFLTIRNWRKAKAIMQEGVTTTAIVKHIHSQRYYKGGVIDHLTLENKSLITDQIYTGRASATHQKFKVGENLPITFLPGNPAKFTIDGGRAYWPMLIFTILLSLFIVFAVYKINEMVSAENRTYKFNPPWNK